MANDPRTGKQLGGALLGAAVVVAALGYFVDIYDLVLFSILWKPSLASMGITGKAATDWYVNVLSVQMVGMLLGGVVFGILGDRRGRLQILFGSITLYSLATLANGLVHGVEAYTACRFVAGVGLAGELGAGVTLVAEILPASRRGLGTMLVAAVGVSGAVFANLLAGHFGWRAAYFSGGGLGLLLLVLRIGVAESGMFRSLEGRDVPRGAFLSLFTRRDRFTRFAQSVLIGIPIWFAQAVLMGLSPELAPAIGVAGPVLSGNAIAAFYFGLVAGDLASGTLSQLLRSRRRVVLLFLGLLTVAIGAYFVLGRGASPELFYGLCVFLGVASGYWAIFVTIGAEQFGTNLRATVATSVPNFVRGLVVPIVAGYRLVRDGSGPVPAALAIGAACLVVAFAAASGLRETFGADLDYVEE